MSKGRDAARAIVFGALIGIILLSTGGCIYCFKGLLTPGWIPAAVTLVMTVALGLPMRGLWRWLTGSDSVALALVCQVLSVWPMLTCVVLAVNMAGAGHTTSRVEVPVVRVYQETRHQTRRTGRRSYVQGPPYKVCRIDIDVPGAGRRSLDVPRKTYRRVDKGDTIGIDITTGQLGMRYFDATDLHLRPTPEKERKHRSPGQRRHDRYREHIDSIRKHI